MSFVFEGKSHKWQTVRLQVKVPKCVDKWMRPLKFHPSINIKWKDYLPKRWSPVVLKSHTYVNTLKLAIQAYSTHSLLFVVEYCAKVTHVQTVYHHFVSTLLSTLRPVGSAPLPVVPQSPVTVMCQTLNFELFLSLSPWSRNQLQSWAGRRITGLPSLAATTYLK